MFRQILWLFICRYLATGSSFTALAFTFRVGETTIGKIIHETTEALWDELHPVHMPVPTRQTFHQIARDFLQIWNAPNVIGCIDGKHIRVKCPAKSGSMYFNYKQFFSVVLQGVADAHYKFAVIDVGGYGKQSDGGTFQASHLYQLITKKKIDIPEPSFLPGTDVQAPHVLFADEGYPLLPFVMKPYRGTNLNYKEECYNNRLSRARKVVECAFGILASKWRLLLQSIACDISGVDSIVKACCILHNTIIDREGVEHNLTDVRVLPRVQMHPPGRTPNNAKDVRDVFATYFANNPIVYGH